jgi:hypothetical protein
VVKPKGRSLIVLEVKVSRSVYFDIALAWKSSEIGWAQPNQKSDIFLKMLGLYVHKYILYEIQQPNSYYHSVTIGYNLKIKLWKFYEGATVFLRDNDDYDYSY